MTTITRATWDGIADTALTGVQPEGRTSEERILELLAAQTEPEPEPVALARRARHRRPKAWRRPLLPLWAGALLLAFQALHEAEAATAAQLAEPAQAGAM